MNRRTVLPAALVAVVAVGSFAPAMAKPKRKPITKTFTASAPVPHPYPPSGPSCSDNPATPSEHHETLKVPAKGKLTVTLTGFTGDWDLGLFDKAGNSIAEGAGVNTPNANTGNGVEELTAKIKKPGTYIIDACNFAGGPTASGTIKFVFG